MVLFGALVFLLYNVHYLILMLRIELILLGIVSLLVGRVSFFFFLLLIVCVGAFRVSLLVSLFRGYGRDY
jgi:hypothetical protein